MSGTPEPTSSRASHLGPMIAKRRIHAAARSARLTPSTLDVAAFRAGGNDRQEEHGAVEDRLRPERSAEQVHSVEADRKQDDRNHNPWNVVIAGATLKNAAA